MFGGLAADQRSPGLFTAARNAGDDVGDALGHDLAARDVVSHEQGSRTDDDDVIDNHADEVLADRVVLVDGLRDRDLGTDTVGACREQRTPVGTERGGIEQAGEATDTAEDFGALGATDRSLHEFDGEVTRCRVDTGRGVRITGGVVGVHPNRLPARPQLSSRIQGGG